MNFCHLHFFFFQKRLLSGIPSVCQTVCIQIRPDILGPNCLQGLAAGDTSRQRDYMGLVARKPDFVLCQ